MSTDPRIIAVALEDLRQEVVVWSATASQTLAAAYYAQRNARETAERAFHRAAVVIDGAQQDGERVSKITSDANAIVDQSENARGEAEATLLQAREELADATSTLEFWEEELRKALAWLERAEARLARAIAEYERAQSAFEHAKWALDRAQSQYNSCLRDKNRSNCNSEAKAVNSAQEELQSAAYRLQLAQAEVIAAREEVAAARARVQCCSNAVHYATEAVNMAREAESQAEQAVNSVERSFEFAKAAEQNALVAKEKVIEETSAAEQMLAAAREAISMTDEAAVRLRDADSAEELTQRYAHGGRRELEHRVRLLREIDTPDLNDSVAGSGRGSADGRSVSVVEARRSTWIAGGIKFVNVADLPDPEDISGPADFKKATVTEIRSGIEKLQEMKPLIESGVGATSDYWAEYDKERKLEYAEGYKKVYEVFYGNDCIKVNKDQNSYDVDSGRHRIWVAKQMGVEQLPMRVQERGVDE
jgi:exonuclease VII small subunit